jgi:hypothetical protein
MIKIRFCDFVIDDEIKYEQFVVNIDRSIHSIIFVKSSRIGKLSFIDTHVLIFGKMYSDVTNSHQ